MQAEFGIIGGSGLYSLIENPESIDIDTDFGKPSDKISIGTLGGKRVAFLPRHGSRHTLPPHKIPYKANIEALKKLGVKRIITTNAIGSLNPDYKIGDFVLFDQFVNMTHGRDDTYFHSGKVVHISAADPYCEDLRKLGSQVAKDLKIDCHDTGTAVVINGPRFSTRAESRNFGSAGFDVINMTQYPEVILAREKEMCYLGIGIVTDYDAGLEGREIEAVNYDYVKTMFGKSMEKITPFLVRLVEQADGNKECRCRSALEGAVVEA